MFERFTDEGRRIVVYAQEPSGHIPFTRHVRETLELALRVSVGLRQKVIGPPHLLCALLDIKECGAVQLLLSLGVDTGSLAAVARRIAIEESGDGPAVDDPGQK